MGIATFPAASAAALTQKVQDFTSSGTWTAPSGVYSAKFVVVGAGGAGGGTVQLNTEYASGGGGGGGAYKEMDLAVTPGTSYTITVGAKGSGAAGGVGGNGGFSEVLNGATSLIKCFGGLGGAAITASGATETKPTVISTIAGGGGAANGGTTDRNGGGGGGANPAITGNGSAWGIGISGGEGTPGRSAGTTGITTYANGAMGFNGYGAGGGGGVVYSTTLYTSAQGGSQFAGNGGIRNSAGVTNGSAAVANTGCGGGGATAFLNATTTTGGNGADGLVRVVYFA